MVTRIDHTDPAFEDRFAALLAAKRETSEDVDAAVRAIVADVRERGDAAVVDATRRFDRFDLMPETMRIDDGTLEAAADQVDTEALDALSLAKARIEAFHRRHRPQDDRHTDDLGVELGQRWTPVDAVGIYVPGGTAAYPSSVLMNAVPAKVAGVERVVMTVPTPDGTINPLVLAAARLAGMDEVYRVGGAQAVAALAYGTRSIDPVAKIVGPGNAYVAAAKRQVFGVVGIDMIAGPSEVLVIADAENDPDWIAADLLAQAEHDAASQSILITDSVALADQVAAAVDRHLATLARGEIAAASWRDHGAIITVDTLDRAATLANRIAPEHLELAVADPEALSPAIRHAGSIFLGRYTPEAIGDYVGGPNHVLPTARSARFSSGLSVYDFLKRTTTLKLGPDQLRALGPAAITLAEAEGLEAHARSVAIRMNR
ncbi:histidinol dehydrogenase [Bauldia sp.]|uniref:histidinol dehydrogenase n=1 Tax=Bauldia sp. TaxID=2575872 RepID=UPI003BACC85A